MSRKQKIIIIGGGFGGVRCAKDLAHFLNDRAEIILIDQNDYHLYQPALYEVATATCESAGELRLKNTIALSFKKIFCKTAVIFKQGKVKAIDMQNKTVAVGEELLTFDWLVLAIGSKEEYYGIAGAKQYAFPLKTLSQAIVLRNHIDAQIKTASQDFNAGAARIIIAGGGFVALEFAGELRNYLLRLAEKYSVPKDKIELMIVEAADSLLPGMSKKVSQICAKRLELFDIEIKLNVKITDVEKNYIILSDGEKIFADTVVWAAGIRGDGENISGLPMANSKGRFMVGVDLRLNEFNNVFFVGDVNYFINEQTKKSLPQLAQVAIDEGRYAAQAIYRLINGQSLRLYKSSVYGFIIPLAGKYAIFCSANGRVVVSGFLGWLMRRFADLRYFLSVLPFWSALKIWMSENILYIKND